ncbi:MAG: glycosyltransferase family 4 protein [Thermoleophilaceae bacterium]
MKTEVGYLCSRYPAVSHTFVLREVRALRARGVHVHTFSIRRPRDSELLSSADREERKRTWYVLPANPLRLLAAHASAFARRPLRYLATFAEALRLSPGGVRGAFWQLFYFAESMLVARECRRRGIRHLHVHFANVGADVALLAARYGAVDGFSFTLHGPTELADVAAHRLAEKARAARFVVCISDFARSQLMALLPADEWPKLHVVRCGVDPREFAAVTRNGGADANGSGAVRVLNVGQAVERKGQALLVEALAQLADRGLDVRATVVGDGPARAALERLAERGGVADRIDFAGAVGQDEIRAHYGRADVFCLPSFAEGVPVVLMEAMATGLPVVASSVMGVPELVEDGTAGLLVPPGRVDRLADALARLAGDPGLRSQMGAAGRRTVESDWSLERSAEQLEGLFEGAREGA